MVYVVPMSHKYSCECRSEHEVTDERFTMHQVDTNQQKAFAHLRIAALDRRPIKGLTHTFYRYPARFSPVFARAAIEAYSKPNQVVLDPYMGGGTTVIEALAAGRRAVGTDLNSLACFVARVKSTPLSATERQAVAEWAHITVQELRYGDDLHGLVEAPRNLHLPAARPLRKTIALSINAAERDLPTEASRRFARCVMLNVGQWALNGRRCTPQASEMRKRVSTTCTTMLEGLHELKTAVKKHNSKTNEPPVIVETDASRINEQPQVMTHGLANLIVTSPPYPGIHMLYHRWQVDGRKETDAPYWIAACKDGEGSSFYNFADRRRQAEDRYFEKAESTLRATRKVIRKGGIMVQMIAFSHPARQLKRYLRVMERAGFTEVRDKHERRVWRDVPGRRWHANSKGNLPSSREVVLVHEAV